MSEISGGNVGVAGYAYAPNQWYHPSPTPNDMTTRALFIRDFIKTYYNTNPIETIIEDAKAAYNASTEIK